METWQKEYIVGNVTHFIQDIDCNMLLIGHLLQVGVLSDADVSKLKAVGDAYEKRYLLLEILRTRTGAFRHLAKALYNCKQTGALLRLLDGIERHLPKENPFVFCGIELNTNEILSKECIFEGSKLPLNDLCNSIEKTHLKHILSLGMDASSYDTLIKDEPITIASSTVPEALSYYIPRTLSINTKLDPMIFANLQDDTFCIEGVERQQLSALATAGGPGSARGRNATPDLSRHQVHRLTARFIFLENPAHFQTIASKTDKVVHWIRYLSGDYRYVKSSPGSGVKSIQKFVTHQNAETLSQQGFVGIKLDASTNEPILIYDSPGMGKSVLLAEMARHVKEARTERNVIYFPLRELISKLTNHERNYDSINVKQSLSKIISSNGLGQIIMENLLDSSSHRVELFLDAYDELPESNVSAANIIFESIAKECKNIRMWISTRPHRRHELDEMFGVLGFNILPFSDFNKLSFFLKYWETRHQVSITDKIKFFAEHCLKSLVTRMQSETDITGIPLQCKMLAEIFAEDAKGGGMVCSENHLQFNSVYTMYKTYMNAKFDSLSSDAENQLLKAFHVKEGIRTLFLIEVAVCDQEYNTVENETVYRLGILEANTTSGMQFVHRTLAEFLVAEYVVTSARNPLDNIQMIETIDLLFGSCLAVTREYQTGWYHWYHCSWNAEILFIYPVVTQFIDFFLSTMDSSSHALKQFKQLVKISKYNNLDTFLKLIYASLESSALHLFLFLCDIFLNIGKSSDGSLTFKHFPLGSELDCTVTEQLERYRKDCAALTHLVYYSVRHSSFELVKVVCEFLVILTGKEWHQYNYDSVRFPLRIAIERGHYQTFEYLLNFDKENLYDENLLRFCMQESFYDSLDVITRKLQIAKLILQERPELLHRSHSKYKLVPLLTYGAHFELIKLLVEAGAQTTSTDSCGSNVAATAALYFSPQDYHKLTLLLISKGANMIFRQRDRGGYTPVHWAVDRIDLTTDTLEMLSNECNVRFNDNNNTTGESELACAIKGGRSHRVINDIYRLGGRRWKMYNIFRVAWYFIRKRF